ncbi:MAG: hypothetical protein QW472_02940 [Candidatus Aenigmatarchaeota archaeon]
MEERTAKTLLSIIIGLIIFFILVLFVVTYLKKFPVEVVFK